MSRRLLAPPVVAGVLPLALVLLALGGCNGGGVAVSLPAANATPIANCIVDSENDVEIGATDAPPGCANVVLSPSSGTRTFANVRIGRGGTLTITGGSPGPVPAMAANGTPLPPIARVTEICIDKGGTLEMGAPGKPIDASGKVKLTFIGDRLFASIDPICKDDFQKGILVNPGASLLMYGAKGVPSRGGVSWTTLAAPAGSAPAGARDPGTGPYTLHLAADVSKGTEGWTAGDWIVVAATGFDPFDSEFVQIASVQGNSGPTCESTPQGCSTVTLKQPLKHYHFGSLPPSSATATCAATVGASATQPKFLCDDASRNYGVDERAEVGLISRDIELTSETEPPPVTTVPPPATASVHWGGEIMIHAGFKKVAIQGVRLSKFGKDQLGSYPLHFHRVGNAGNAPLIDADSVDHSYNKCVTIHSTSNLTISNLVCARILGHIFYEEMQSMSEDNPADDSGLVFNHDLGIGAMSNDFDIYGTGTPGQTRQDLINRYWWTGDYMTNSECSSIGECIGYDGFNVPDTDNQMQAVHGFCWGGIDPNNGQFINGSITTPCASGSYYVEPASGFWIQNPKTILTGNAIAGCQGLGVAYWWNSPGSGQVKVNGQSVDLSAYRFGKVRGDRASGCYWGYNDAQELFVTGNQLSPHKGDITSSPPLVAVLDDITATHIRRRAVWLRPLWFAITNSHFADNNRSVSLVTSGGIDGNAPGVWELLEDSVLVGESVNNIGRWGPCPQAQPLGPYTGWEWGCIDYSHPQGGQQANAHSGELNGLGYPSPARNSYGYMIYDGPVRIFHDRFVNYNYDNPVPPGTNDEFSSQLDDADRAALQTWQTNHNKPYEGDAALGWFDSNQNAYPVTTASKELTWVNTNFRHQIYTQYVNLDQFNDGDKNTAIIDEDGTLDGFGVVLAPGAGTIPEHPISLNNLPFNATSNSVDECLSRGAQNEADEGRDTSLMSPSEIGQLELSDLYPFRTDSSHPAYPGVPNSHFQLMTFTRTDQIPDGNGGVTRPGMTLKYGRNGQGLYEPKVANRHGYYTTVAPSASGQEAGIWSWIEVGLVDIEDPNITKSNPFYIKLGINYTDANGNHPPSADYFTIDRGYKAYRGGSITFAPQYANGDTNHMLDYWTDWAPPVYDPGCFNIDDSNRNNVPHDGKPAGCPGYNADHPLRHLTKVSSIDALYTNGKPNLDVYYYNPATGYLWFNLAQDEANPIGPSPTGSCDSAEDGGVADPTCPLTQHGESYYGCPKTGCIIYSIAVTGDSAYTYAPGPSTGAPAAASLAPPPSTSQSADNQLVVAGNPGNIIQRAPHLDKQGTVYYTATNAPACTTTQPPLP